MVNNLEKRARLFLSFDSLKGFKNYLKAKQKITVDPVELAPDALDELDWKIKQVQPGMMITVVYYNQGEYVLRTGLVSKIDFECKRLTIVNQEINFNQIIKISDL